jgi:DNA-binding GntR family transcriptional regulator
VIIGANRPDQISATTDRHMDEAATHMRRHLESVRKGLMESYANIG